MWASTQTPHELRAFCARLLGIPAQGVRVIMRDTGGGFGQKVVPMREDMCIMLAARKVPAALKWIEDRRENLMSAGQARHVDGKARMAFDDEGNILAVDIDFVQDVGRVPDAVSGADHRRHRHVLPRPVPGSEGQLQLQDGVLEHRGSGGLPRAMAVRDPRARNPARHRRAQDGHGSRRSAPQNMLRRDEMPYFNPNGMPYDHVAPVETFEQAVKILDHEGFRKEQADALEQGRYIGLGFSAYIEPTGGRDGQPRHRGRNHPHGADRQDQRLRERRLVRQQHRDHRRPADGRRAGRRHRRRRHHPGRYRGDAVRRRHPGQPKRADDGRRGQRGGHDAAQTDRGDGRPPSRASTKPTSSWPTRGPASATTPRRA